MTSQARTRLDDSSSGGWASETDRRPDAALDETVGEYPAQLGVGAPARAVARHRIADPEPGELRYRPVEHGPHGSWRQVPAADESQDALLATEPARVQQRVDHA